MTLTSAILLTALLGAQPQGEVLDFSATWCGPCQQMSPLVSRLERQGYPIRKIDFDSNKALARKYGVTSLPTFLLVINGKEVNRIEGMTSEGQLKRMLGQIPTKPAASKKSSPKNSLLSGMNISMPKLKRRRSVPKSSDIRLVDDKKTKSSFNFPSLFSQKEEPREVNIDAPRPPKSSNVAGQSDNSYNRRLKKMRNAEPSVNRVSPAAASCRLQVRDNSGVNFGSGTIIASKPGQSIILTCGHIFRNLKEEAEIQVDVFTKGQIQKFKGNLIRFDKEADVGLLSIASREAFPIAHVARIGESVAKSDLVISIGCNGGKSPTREQLRVTALNRYLGPDNIECSGVPAEGRSGGGLFNSKGHVVGVCIAADTKEKRGLFAGLKAVHQILEDSQLAMLYRNKNETNPALAKTNVNTTPRLEPTGNGQARITSLEETSSELETPFSDMKSADSASASEDQLKLMQAALQQAGEADIICFVRPNKETNEKSRVVIIHRASSKFKKYLADEQRPSSRQPRAKSTTEDHHDAHDHSEHQHPHAKKVSPFEEFERSRPEPFSRTSTSKDDLIQTTARETEPSYNHLQRYRRDRAKQ